MENNLVIMTFAILGTSIFLQFTAAALAFRLMRVTRQSRAWGLIAIAITLMAIRRSVTGYRVFTADSTYLPDMSAEYIALTITILMVVGLAFIAPFFSTLQRSQQAIRKSEQRYKILANNSPVGIFHTTPDGKFLDVNEQYIRITGLTREEAMGEGWLRALHPDDRQHVQEVWSHSREIDIPFQLEYRFLHPDGSIRWVYGQTEAQKDDAGCVEGYIGTLTDMTIQKQEEREFRGLLESSPDAMVIVNSLGIIVRVNKQTEAMFGYSREELLGKAVETIIPERFCDDHSGYLKQFFKDVRVRPMGAGIELFGLRKDRSEFPVEISLGPIVTPTETLVCAAIRDFTARKHAERKLHDQETRVRLLLDSTAEAIYGLDLQGRCTFLNSACLKILGYQDVDQVLGENMHNLIHHTCSDGSADPEQDCQIFKAFRNREGTHVDDEVLWRSDGTSFPAEYWSYPVIQEGVVIGTVVTFIDISDRKNAEMELKESEERFRQLAESINQVFWLTDWKNKKLLYVSPAYETIFGQSCQSAYEDRQSWANHIHPEDRSRVLKDFAIHAELGKYIEAEYRLLRKDGAIRWVKDRAFPVFDDQGEVTRVVGIAEDITERKHTEAEKENLENQLHQSQKLEAIGQLAGGIAHDFNNILTAIIGNTELLLKKAIKEISLEHSMKPGLVQIDRAAKRAAALTRQLLTFSRKQSIQPIVFNLNQTIMDIKPMLISLLGDHITFVYNPSETGSYIRADAGQMEQVLINLAVNARDAMPNGGTLTIQTEILEVREKFAREHPKLNIGFYICLNVIDTGTGMDQATLDRMYEPFFTTKPVGQGTGLGLATVYGIVEQSGGDIVTNSELGKGTEIQIYLPSMTKAQVEKDNVGKDHLDTKGDETVLVCEDEEDVRILTCQTLQQNGYHVLSAKDAHHALDQAAEYDGQIHLLLTDAVMPGMNGHELAKLMTKQRPDTGVLYMSGYASDILPFDRDGISNLEFLQKPFDSQVLLHTLRSRLNQLKQQDATTQVSQG